MEQQFILNFREFIEAVEETPLQVGTPLTLQKNPQYGLSTSNVSGIVTQGGQPGQKNVRLPAGQYKVVGTNPINIQVSPINAPNTVYVIPKTELARRDEQAYRTLFPKPAAPQARPGFFKRLFGGASG